MLHISGFGSVKGIVMASGNNPANVIVRKQENNNPTRYTTPLKS
jgi:hypothetical protein